MIVAYLPLLLPLHYAMWRTQLSWSISRVRCEVTSSLLKAIAMKTFSLQRQQERGRKATIVGSLLQSFAAADYQMTQCSHCNQWYHVNCTHVPKTVLNNNKAYWHCEDNIITVTLDLLSPWHVSVWLVIILCIQMGITKNRNKEMRNKKQKQGNGKQKRGNEKRKEKMRNENEEMRNEKRD